MVSFQVPFVSSLPLNDAYDVVFSSSWGREWGRRRETVPQHNRSPSPKALAVSRMSLNCCTAVGITVSELRELFCWLDLLCV